MDYFSEKSNPFYERTCNNEIVRMQRQSMDNLKWVFLTHFTSEYKVKQNYGFNILRESL